MNKYVLSLEAEKDIEGILDFGIYKFGITQAEKYLLELEEYIIALSKNPKLGRLRNEIRKDLLSFAKSSHIIFYRMEIDHIFIVRVLSARQDIPDKMEY